MPILDFPMNSVTRMTTLTNCNNKRRSKTSQIIQFKISQSFCQQWLSSKEAPNNVCQRLFTILQNYKISLNLVTCFRRIFRNKFSSDFLSIKYVLCLTRPFLFFSNNNSVSDQMLELKVAQFSPKVAKK